MRSPFMVLILPLALTASLAAAQDAPREYFGQLGNQPVPGTYAFKPFRLEAAPEGAGEELPVPLAAGDRLFTGILAWQRGGELSARLALVETASGAAFLHADTDLDGKLSAAERFAFPRPRGDDWKTGGVRLTFPVRTDKGTRPYPVLVLAALTEPGVPAGSRRQLLASNAAYLDGTVDLGGKKTLVRYTVDPRTGAVDPRSGELGIDGNGDGKIDDTFGSPEWDLAVDEEPVFPAGGLYVSTRSVDAASGLIVLRSRPAADAVRFDLRQGAQLPDFSFTDFDGKTRKLSELRGKYVLLDFWATWCLPCVEELPNLLKVYEEYAPRGFEIVGMDNDEDLAAARAIVSAQKLPWPQATPASIDTLIEKQFRVRRFPTAILLDPEGRVVSTGGKDQPPLIGARLAETLAKLLPPSPPRPPKEEPAGR